MASTESVVSSHIAAHSDGDAGRQAGGFSRTLGLFQAVAINMTQITASYRARDLGGAAPVVSVSGWNTGRLVIAAGR